MTFQIYYTPCENYLSLKRKLYLQTRISFSSKLDTLIVRENVLLHSLHTPTNTFSRFYWYT